MLFLSNYAEHTMYANPRALDFLPYMDGGVFSCDEGVVKPDPRIYMTIIGRFNLNPADCVFLDDSKANVLTAKAYGMKAIHFEDYESAKNQLEEMLL